MKAAPNKLIATHSVFLMVAVLKLLNISSVVEGRTQRM